MDAGATFDAYDSNHNSLLHYWTFEKSDPELLKFLLDNGLNIEHANGNGETPLVIASRFQNVEAVKMLFKVGANSRAKDRQGRSGIGHFLIKGNYSAADELWNLGLWHPEKPSQ